jgi:undecaprenyl diphosphate synthase
MHVRVAVDYSSRNAITQAALAMCSVPDQDKDQRSSTDLLGQLLAEERSGTDDVDLLIRTGGEQRLSDFLLWESAYAELLFLDRMWPDFSAGDLEAALKVFEHRERRFGGIPAAALCPTLSAAGA